MHDMLRDIWSRVGGVAEWARDHNCTFGMSKTQLCDLTRRRVKHAFLVKKRVRMPRAPLVLVEGVTAVPEKVVKVLGILIDDELRWKEQAAVAVAKGQDWLIQFGRLAKMGTGVSMANMRRLWLAVAIPRIMYRVDVWMTPYRHNPGAVLKRDGRAVVGKMKSIQRRAAIMMTGALSSTSGDLLNVHADLQPIEILVDRKLHNEALRLATLEEDAKEEDEEDEAEVQVYSDGSGLGGQVGAAAVRYRDFERARSRRYRLGSLKEHTVYEGEAVGAILALHLIWEEKRVRGKVSLGIDNQAAIAATTSLKPTPSHYLFDLFHQQLHRAMMKHPLMRLHIRWTPGHVDIEGNEAADELARKAAEQGSSDLRSMPVIMRKPLPKSKSAMKQDYNARLKCVMAKKWSETPSYTRLKEIDPSLPSPSFRKLTAKLARPHASLLIQLRSHHVALAKHLHRITKAELPTCPCCHGRDETVDHYLFHCRHHVLARQTMLREGGRDTSDKSKLLSVPTLIPHLLRFIKTTQHFRTTFPNLPDPVDPEDDT